LKGTGVGVAALGLVAAVWLSLELSRRASDGGAGPSAPAPTDFGELRGFRSDAWYLPDEELLGFVEVQGGPFTMGSDPAQDPLAFDIERWSQEVAQGTVHVPTFYIQRYETTVSQFSAFVAATSYRGADPEALSGLPTGPVTSVAWTDALAYTRWLEDVLELWPEAPPLLRRLLDEGWRVGLPSEAEWEKAARGLDGRIFPWGDSFSVDRVALGGASPRRVGSIECPECPYGLADMAGNVWEWTRTPYQSYPLDESTTRIDLDSDALFVMRGGSFGDPPRQLRAANRGRADPGARRPFIGFRVVISRF
jgi:formylglycine-generating enzyme required for sulfatase activity